MSYQVAHLDSNRRLVKDTFLQAEKVRLNRPMGDLDKGYYGFMHMFELPQGTYYMVGREGRGYDSMVAAGGIFITTPNSNEITPIMLEIELQGGKVNYLGEILVQGKPLTNSSIILSNRWERDLETADRTKVGIIKFESVHVIPRKVDVKELQINFE